MFHFVEMIYSVPQLALGQKRMALCRTLGVSETWLAAVLVSTLRCILLAQLEQWPESWLGSYRRDPMNLYYDPQISTNTSLCCPLRTFVTCLAFFTSVVASMTQLCFWYSLNSAHYWHWEWLCWSFECSLIPLHTQCLSGAFWSQHLASSWFWHSYLWLWPGIWTSELIR